MDKETGEVRTYKEFNRLRGQEVVKEQIKEGRIVPVKTRPFNRFSGRMGKGKIRNYALMHTDKMIVTRERIQTVLGIRPG